MRFAKARIEKSGSSEGPWVRKGPAKGVEKTVLTSSDRGGDRVFHERVINHEERPTQPAACLVDPPPTSPGDQPGWPQAKADPHPVGTLRRGPGRAAGIDRSSQGLCLVPAGMPASNGITGITASRSTSRSSASSATTSPMRWSCGQRVPRFSAYVGDDDARRAGPTLAGIPRRLGRRRQRHVDLEEGLMARAGTPSELAAGLFHDLGGAGEAEAETSAGLATAVERVEEVVRLRGADPLAIVAERPDQLAVPCAERTWIRPPGGVAWSALRSRISARCRRPSGSAQVLGAEASRSASSRTPREELSRSNSPSRARAPHRACKAGDAVRADGRQTSGRGGCGGPAAAWPVMIRSEHGLGILGPGEQQLARPTITASGLFSSWPAPAANSPSASIFPRRSRSSSAWTRPRDEATTAWSRRSSRERSASRSAQALQARRIVRELSSRTTPGPSPSHQSSATAARRRRHRAGPQRSADARPRRCRRFRPRR